MPGAGLLNIIRWRNGVLAQKQTDGVTPQEIAAILHSSASGAFAALPELRRATVTPAASVKEYAATLGDIEAMSHLGLYYAAKIRGACDLALFDKTGDAGHRPPPCSTSKPRSAIGKTTPPPTPANTSNRALQSRWSGGHPETNRGRG